MPYSDFIEKYLAIPVQPGLYSLDLENSDLDSSSIVPVCWIVLVPLTFIPMHKTGGMFDEANPASLCFKHVCLFLLVTCRAHGTTCRIHLAGPIHGEHCRTSWKKQRMIQSHLLFRYAFHMLKKLQKHG